MITSVGTTNLFAALNTATGQVVGRCFDRRRTAEFLKFMDQVVAAYPGRELHVVLDNLSTHMGEEVNVRLSTMTPRRTSRATGKTTGTSDPHWRGHQAAARSAPVATANTSPATCGVSMLRSSPTAGRPSVLSWRGARSATRSGGPRILR